MLTLRPWDVNVLEKPFRIYTNKQGEGKFDHRGISRSGQGRLCSPALNRGPFHVDHDPTAPSVGANPRRIVFSTTLRGSMN